MAIGRDGFARIAYAVDNRGDAVYSNTLVYLIQCFDDDCSTYSDTFVDGGSGSFVTSVAVAGDGTAYIVYDYGQDFDESNLDYYSQQGVGLATCSGGSCSLAKIAPVYLFDVIGADIAIDQNGNPIILHEDGGCYCGDGTPTDTVNYVANGASTVVSTDGYGWDASQNLVLGPDGYARIAFMGNEGTDFIDCTSSACSNNAEASLPNIGLRTDISLAVDSDGNAIITTLFGGSSAGRSLDYLQCTAADCSTYGDQVLANQWSFYPPVVSVNIDSDGVPRLLAQANAPQNPGAVNHVRVPASVTLVQRSSTGQFVSQDDGAANAYITAEGTTALGPIIGSGSEGAGCYIGNEMVGRVKPSNYTGNVVLHRWVLFDKTYDPSNRVIESVSNVDDTSQPPLMDTDPQSGGSAGKVYDLDAPGLGDNSQSNATFRYRANFYAWAALPDGKRISPYYPYYVRVSCQLAAPGGYQFDLGLPGDNQIGPGTTVTTWNFQ